VFDFVVTIDVSSSHIELLCEAVPPVLNNDGADLIVDVPVINNVENLIKVLAHACFG
jgi:hypothetical protein